MQEIVQGKYVYTVSYVYNEGSHLDSVFLDEKTAVERCDQMMENNSKWVDKMCVPLDIFLKYTESMKIRDENDYQDYYEYDQQFNCDYNRYAQYDCNCEWCDKDGYTKEQWENAAEHYKKHASAYSILVTKHTPKDLINYDTDYPTTVFEDENFVYGRFDPVSAIKKNVTPKLYEPSLETNTIKNLEYVYEINHIRVDKFLCGYEFELDKFTEEEFYLRSVRLCITADKKNAFKYCEHHIKREIETHGGLDIVMITTMPLDIYLNNINRIKKTKNGEYKWQSIAGYSAKKWKKAHEIFMNRQTTTSYKLQIIKYPVKDVVNPNLQREILYEQFVELKF